MAFPQCPPIVRLMAREATFARPSMDIAHVTTSPINEDRYTFQARRSISMLWWSEEDPETAMASAHNVADWLVKMLSHGGEQRLSVFRIYDWSTESPRSTNEFMEIDALSIDARPLPDEYGFWMTALDFRYTVCVDWPLEPAPDVERFNSVSPTTNRPMKIILS